MLHLDIIWAISAICTTFGVFALFELFSAIWTIFELLAFLADCTAAQYDRLLAASCRPSNVREYVFYVFFRFQKTWLFTFSSNDVSKSRKKSLAKV